MVQRTPHAIPLLLSKGVTTVFSSCTLSQLLKVGFGVAEWREETDWRKNSWCESPQNPGCEHTCYPNHSVYPFYWIKLTCSKDLNLKGLKLTNIIIAGGPVKDSFLNSWENHVWESKTQRTLSPHSTRRGTFCFQRTLSISNKTSAHAKSIHLREQTGLDSSHIIDFWHGCQFPCWRYFWKTTFPVSFEEV